MQTNHVPAFMLILMSGLSTQLFSGNYGPAYEHFKQNSLNINEQDLHLLHDAFHISLHFTDQQSTDLVSQIKDKISTAQTQSSQVGSLIANTQNLIQFVKEAKDAISNPTSLLKDTVSKFWSRALSSIGTDSPQQLISNLEGKVAEAKANQLSIDRALTSANGFLNALETVKGLFGGQQSAWQKVKGFFGFSAAHLEKFADQPLNLKGKRRLSLYQQEARRQHLLNLADKLKKALTYLNAVPEEKLNVHDFERHLYDLVEEEGALGSAYLRFVETLKCILLKTSPVCGPAPIPVAIGGTTGPQVVGTNVSTQTNTAIVTESEQAIPSEATQIPSSTSQEENGQPPTNEAQTQEQNPTLGTVVQQQEQPPANTAITEETTTSQQQPQQTQNAVQNQAPIYSSTNPNETEGTQPSGLSLEHPVAYFGQTQVIDASNEQNPETGIISAGTEKPTTQQTPVFQPTAQSDIIVVNENSSNYLPSISDIPTETVKLEEVTSQAGNQ